MVLYRDISKFLKPLERDKSSSLRKSWMQTKRTQKEHFEFHSEFHFNASFWSNNYNRVEMSNFFRRCWAAAPFFSIVSSLVYVGKSEAL
jgi:hypothetical protein